MDFLLPPLCIGCDQTVTENQTLCASCWQEIDFIVPPCCLQCGLPFDFEVDGEALCGQCHAEPPSYERARSAFIYNDASKGIILRLKHADQIHPAPALAKWMARAGKELLEDVDMIMPVPLHRWRLLKRRYNQSALLAGVIGKHTGINVVMDGLVRTKPTPSQGRMNRKQRYKNVKNAFSVRPGVQVKGQKILLIDDVMTSGATVDACAHRLKVEGASMVNVLTLARVQ